MPENWSADVRRYVPDPDQAAINGLVEYLGAGLKTRQETRVSCGDVVERERIRDKFLRKTLGIGDHVSLLDRAIIAVCDRMRDDAYKSGVTFYYLLAEKYGKLAQFH